LSRPNLNVYGIAHIVISNVIKCFFFLQEGRTCYSILSHELWEYWNLC